MSTRMCRSVTGCCHIAVFIEQLGYGCVGLASQEVWGGGGNNDTYREANDGEQCRADFR
jgi:hypothetical protein